jgi:hypothetical protein
MTGGVAKGEAILLNAEAQGSIPVPMTFEGMGNCIPILPVGVTVPDPGAPKGPPPGENGPVLLTPEEKLSCLLASFGLVAGEPLGETPGTPKPAAPSTELALIEV